MHLHILIASKYGLCFNVSFVAAVRTSYREAIIAGRLTIFERRTYSIIGRHLLPDHKAYYHSNPPDYET